MNRRDFFRVTGGGLAALTAWWAGPRGYAQEPAPDPAATLVGLARSDRLYLPGPVIAPPGVYPEGKLDWAVVDWVVRQSSAAAGVTSPWNLFTGSDRVAVMIDVARPPVPIILVEAVLEQLVLAGVPTDRILLFSAQERELYAAGFSLRAQGPGVRCLGADALGYRGGLSRIVLDMCDKIVNLACLRPHSRLGMSGALANCLNAWEATRRHAALENPEELGRLVQDRQLRGRLVLHLVDCLHPFYRVPQPQETPDPRWEYRGLICSRDPVAADVIGRQILEAQRAQAAGQPAPLDPPPTWLHTAATRYGLGQADPALLQLEVIGDRTDLLLPDPTSPGLPEPPEAAETAEG